MDTPRLFEPDRPLKPWQGGPLSDPSTPRPAPAHFPGRDTEIEAARLVAPQAGTWRSRVLEAIAAAGEVGMTDWELHERLGGALYTVAPRRAELVRMGWLADSGRRRSTNTGRSAIVWVLSAAGRAQLGLRGAVP
mgnify:CR=1 FL=1